MRFLSGEQEDRLKEERSLMNDLQVALVRFGVEPGDEEALRASIQQLDELFLLVVVGEFNSGKSAVINALLGQKRIEEGVTPTTTQVTLIRYGEKAENTLSTGGQNILTFPIEFLAGMTVVDTPGTNAIIREHEAITTHFVPRSDLVLFITSADRPFTESERAFLERIRDWGKKVVFVINKIDILENEQEIDQIAKFVLENAHHLLGTSPEVYPLSARLALHAKQGKGACWEKSRFEPFERYLHQTLDEKSRLRLKLLNPLGVGLHLLTQTLGIIDARMAFLKTDVDLLADVDSQMALYKEDTYRDFRFRIADLENVLLDMEKRGQDFFDDTFRLGRILDLLSKTRVQQEFERQVAGDVPQRIEKKVNELIDWMVGSDLKQWQAVTEHLAVRHQAHKDRIVGDVGSTHFHYDRERLLDAVGREAWRVVDSYDKNREAQAIAENARNTVAASAAVEAGAVGLGALVTTLATTAAADVTGILMASLMAALGLFIIPARRRQAKAKMMAKIAGVRDQLMASLRSQFEKEIDRSLHRIQEAIGPYSRFVRAEREKLLDTEGRLKHLKNEMERLKIKLERL